MTPPTTLARLLTVAAERDPGALALRDQGRSWNWAEATAAAGRLGAALDEAGVRPGDRVGVHYRKCAEAFLAMHAVVQRGAIAVPLDPTASAPYLASVVAHTGCQVVLTNEGCRRSTHLLAASGAIRTVIGIRTDTDIRTDIHTDAGAAGPGGEPTAGVRMIGPDEVAGLDPLPARVVKPDDVAYIITTSGSTGVPKGISHTHRSAMAYVDFKLAAYDLGEDDRISDIAPNHFDISTMALWVTPAVGAANVVVPEPFQMLPASLSQLAADEAITVWYSVPYLLTQMLDRGDLDQRDLSALRWVLFGGEMFPPRVLARLMSRWPDARFSNVYGPAEVNACTVHHLQEPPRGEEPVPIGQPVGQGEVVLVPVEVGPPNGAGSYPTDGPGREPPPGQQGEIWVSAPTMMAGYWERPDLDAAVVGSDGDGRRWYRTGDLGHRLPGGDLVFSGRVDHQVKVRGHRIELEAIEAVLEAVDGVANAVATVIRPGDGADIVVAGLVAGPGGPIDIDAVRRHAADHLPAYAVPAAFEPLDTLPTTGSGKLDRRRLRADLAARTTGGTR